MRFLRKNNKFIKNKRKQEITIQQWESIMMNKDKKHTNNKYLKNNCNKAKDKNIILDFHQHIQSDNQLFQIQPNHFLNP